MRLVMGLVLPLLAVSVAEAGLPPDPFSSDYPDCLCFAPDGSITTTITLRDFEGNPTPGYVTRLIVTNQCVDLLECPTGSPPFVYNAVSDANGDVTFEVPVGGCCDATVAAQFEVDPGAVTFRLWDTICSPDQDADGAVTLGDFVIFQGAFLTNDVCADLAECDGFVSLADFVTFAQYFLNADCAP